MYSLLLKLTSIGFILLSVSYREFSSLLFILSLLKNNVLLLNKKSIEHKEIPYDRKEGKFIYSFVIEKFFFSFFSFLFEGNSIISLSDDNNSP